ncbi:MAG: hypothetical protein R2798_11035 [Chitinophagales bacterium]|nr:hypothetical protein [Bacteroidota bacterium]MCB9043260.1 hypothetical protein [Chitinophagales bacterium]
MNTNIFKPILFGIALGTLVFFTGPFIFIILLLKFIFTPFGMGRMRGYGYYPMGFYPEMRFAMADKIRKMSDEEYTELKENMKNRRHYCHKQFDNEQKN